MLAVNAHESAGLEVKRDLPSSKTKNVDVAVDVCAMTVDGGVIVYGVDETPDGLKLHPVDLAGARERVSDIVRSSIAEPPIVEIIELPIGPDQGYLVVNVPESHRAPHMVQVKGAHRYYGRDSGGNRILTEGEVARLYDRRRHSEPRSQELVDRLVSLAPRSPTPGSYGTMHLLVRPALQHADLLDRAWGSASAAEASSRIFKLVQQAIGSASFAQPWAPNLGSAVGGTLLRNLDEWLVRRLEGAGQGSDFAVADTGDLRVWIERGAADLRNGGQVFTLRDGAIAQVATHGLAFAAQLLESAAYYGAVDALVVLDGIGDAVTALVHEFGMFHVPGQDSPALPGRYVRTTRTTPAEIVNDPKAVARRLVGPLLDTARQGGPDVFA